jgi:hypothetical protein
MHVPRPWPPLRAWAGHVPDDAEGRSARNLRPGDQQHVLAILRHALHGIGVCIAGFVARRGGGASLLTRIQVSENAFLLAGQRHAVKEYIPRDMRVVSQFE